MNANLAVKRSPLILYACAFQEHMEAPNVNGRSMSLLFTALPSQDDLQEVVGDNEADLWASMITGIEDCPSNHEDELLEQGYIELDCLTPDGALLGSVTVTMAEAHYN